MKRISHSYYVVMIDYDRKGREAIVDPELTRQNVIDRIASGEYDHERIVFIHHVDGMYIEDCTKELISEGRLLALQAAE